MPDDSGASAVNTGVHTQLQYAHTRLRVHWAPGIPRALCLMRARDFWQYSGARAARTRMCVSSLRGALATKQCSLLLAAPCIASACARNDEVAAGLLLDSSIGCAVLLPRERLRSAGRVAGRRPVGWGVSENLSEDLACGDTPPGAWRHPPRPAQLRCGWGEGEERAARRCAREARKRKRSAFLPLFWHCDVASFSSKTIAVALEATNRQRFGPRLESVIQGSGNVDSQHEVRSSGRGGQHGSYPRESGCIAAHPADWRASASYLPLRAGWAVCAWALRG